MLYDYYGFSKETYDIKYPAPGNPELAGKIINLLARGNIPARLDSQRGFDHGLFNHELPSILQQRLFSSYT